MIRGKLGRPSRTGSSDGIALIEFSLVAPIGFLLILSIIVGCVVITNLVQLTNAARDGARAAAICGSVSTAQMPDGSGTCSDTAVAAYITSHLSAIPAGSVLPQIYVCTPSEAAAGTCTSAGVRGIANCQRGRIVEVDMYYDQPLYIPLLSTFFQTNPDGTRRLNASAEATCEQ
ncbi:MAG: pilus assembly protein [Candidatus Dormibacteraeota bacterium]|nr:pilus assembly protein [Candidatus Dormibacteraeota bacterium]MBV9525877.1 pilus assembly protein [Candidatus Dormibacteraeota bacterium]